MKTINKMYMWSISTTKRIVVLEKSLNSLCIPSKTHSWNNQLNHIKGKISPHLKSNSQKNATTHVLLCHTLQPYQHLPNHHRCTNMDNGSRNVTAFKLYSTDGMLARSTVPWVLSICSHITLNPNMCQGWNTQEMNDNHIEERKQQRNTHEWFIYTDKSETRSYLYISPGHREQVINFRHVDNQHKSSTNGKVRVYGPKHSSEDESAGTPAKKKKKRPQVWPAKNK